MSLAGINKNIIWFGYQDIGDRLNTKHNDCTESMILKWKFQETGICLQYVVGRQINWQRHTSWSWNERLIQHESLEW